MTNKDLSRLVYGAVQQEAARLLPRLLEPNPLDREAGLEALGRIGSFEAVPQIMRLLGDPASRVRWAAISALGEIGSLDAVPPLVGLLDDNDAATREAAAQALGTIASEQAVAPLTLRLTDPQPDVRLSVINALGEIGSEAALPALETCMERGSEAERLLARVAIEMIRSAGDESALGSQPILEHPSLARFAEGVHVAWGPEERDHVRGCDLCQRSVAVEFGIKHPTVKVLAEFAAESEQFLFDQAMELHLEDCPRCTLILRSSVLKAWASLIRLGKHLELTVAALHAPMPARAHFASEHDPIYVHESAEEQALTLYESDKQQLHVVTDFESLKPSTCVRLEILGEKKAQMEDASVSDRMVGSVRDAREEYGDDIVVLAAAATPEAVEQLRIWGAQDANSELRRVAEEAMEALGVAADSGTDQ